jgi:hypothetical protein
MELVDQVVVIKDGCDKRNDDSGQEGLYKDPTFCRRRSPEGHWRQFAGATERGRLVEETRLIAVAVGDVSVARQSKATQGKRTHPVFWVAESAESQVRTVRCQPFGVFCL